jgi:hypothetical protein
MRIPHICMILLGIMLIAGCNEYRVKEGSFGPQRVRDPNLPGTQIRWNNVALLDPSIGNKIFVEATNSRRTPTGTLEVWAILRNRTDYDLQLEGRASFYDAAQAPLEGPTAWERIYLPPNATAHYKALSTRLDIGYYTIEVREGR